MKLGHVIDADSFVDSESEFSSSPSLPRTVDTDGFAEAEASLAPYDPVHELLRQLSTRLQSQEDRIQKLEMENREYAHRLRVLEGRTEEDGASKVGAPGRATKWSARDFGGFQDDVRGTLQISNQILF